MLALGAGAVVPAAYAQDQGVAVITSPLEGATVAGLVPITGTATHGTFVRYEVAFAYSPNPTDTWFPIHPPATTPVANDVLTRWDTTNISDGIYTLRLRVFYGTDAFLEAFVPNVRVQNTPSTATPAPEATSTPDPAGTATVTPAIVLPPTSTAPASAPTQASPTATSPAAGPSGGGPAPSISARLLGTAFLAGVRLTVIGFLMLGAYAGVKAALRARPPR